MAFTDLQAVCDGLAAAASTISELRVTAHFPDTITPPTLTFGVPDSLDYDEAMGRGLDVAVFTASLYVSRADDRSGQAKLLGYLAGASSIKTALESDRTLGGACQTLRVEQMTQPGQYEVGGVTYIGCKFTIRVWS